MKPLLAFAAASLIAAVSFNAGAAQPAAERNVAPTINQNFKGDVDVSRWVQSFSGESREVFTAREEVVRAIGLKPGQAVADIGAGTGIYARLFARDVGEQGTVYAVDIAPEFLSYIQDWARMDGLPQVKTILGEDRTPKLPANSADVIFSSDTYHHFEYPMAMLQEMHRALKPGGQMIVVDYERTPERAEHVRADKQTVIREVESGGFRFAGEERIAGFKENYFLRFVKN